jgi:hypothetical protein
MRRGRHEPRIEARSGEKRAKPNISRADHRAAVVKRLAQTRKGCQRSVDQRFSSSLTVTRNQARFRRPQEGWPAKQSRKRLILRSRVRTCAGLGEGGKCWMDLSRPCIHASSLRLRRAPPVPSTPSSSLWPFARGTRSPSSLGPTSCCASATPCSARTLVIRMGASTTKP